MQIQILAIALAAISTPLLPGAPPSTLGTSPTVRLGLSAPLEPLTDLSAFSRMLAERLTWTVTTDGIRRPVGSIRFTAVRIDRGRVTASYQSEPARAPMRTSRVAEAIGGKAFAAFPDVCLTPDDPPADVRAVSGEVALDAERLERGIASLARSGELDRAFRVSDGTDVEWGRHVVLVLAASSSDSDLLVRPLILVLERV